MLNSLYFSNYNHIVWLNFRYFFVLSLVLACLFIFISSVINLLFIQKTDTIIDSGYECGFDPFNDSRLKIEVQFYLTALAFLVFDIEVAYIYPWSLTLGYINSLSYFIILEFLIELLLGYVYGLLIGAFDLMEHF